MTDQPPQEFPPGSGQEHAASSPPPPPPPPPPSWAETQGPGAGWQQPAPPGGGGWGQPPPSPGYGYGYGAYKPTDPLGRPLADWWKRAVAIVIDSVIIAIPVYIVFFVIAGVGSVNANCTTVGGQTVCTSSSGFTGAASLVWLLIALVVPLAYFALLDGSERGQTVGKMALHIATRDASTGGPIGHGRALVRRFIYEVLWYLFFIPGLLNVLSPLWDARRQAWHDKAVNSVVIEVP